MKILYWLPSVILMAIIFSFSSIPSSEMPTFGLWDFLIKKGGHMIGYGLLALAYWYAFGWNKKFWWLVILLAVIYAISDESHQSFVPGRHPSWVDAFVIDGFGAGIAVTIVYWLKIKS